MKKFATNLLTTLAALVFALILAESVSRFFLSPPQYISMAARPADPSPVVASSEKTHLSIAQHPDEGGLYRGSPTGRRLNPNRVVTIENHRLSKKRVVIETNSLGYRNPEIGARPADPAYKRILFLGDSITFQDFLAEDETFVRLVENKAKQDNRHWETINSGVGAISLKTELAILQESGLSLQPDVVVLDFYLNDFQESKGVNIIKLPPLLARSWFLYHLADGVAALEGNASNGQQAVEAEDLPRWQQQFEQRVQFSDGLFNENPPSFNTMVKNNFADYGAAWSDGAWDYMLPLFAELKRLSVEHHFKLVIVGFPIYQQVYTEFVDDYPQQQLKAIGNKLDIPVLDLLPPLRAEALRLRGPSIYHGTTIYADLFYDQCHHTPAGSQLVADQIYLFLREQVK
jgi:lysophospholipase L1-like esterase